LQLLADHPLDRVRRAIEHCRGKGLIGIDSIIHRVERLARCDDEPAALEIAAGDSSMSVSVPLPDINQFNRLLSTGG
jgi:hypothetical protein